MENWHQQKVRLGRTELYAGRLGIGAAYGAPSRDIEEAFDVGCNYFYWGALRNSRMAQAVRNIRGKGKRDDLIIVIQDFRRTPKGVEKSLMRGLKKLGIDYADVLLLGWHNKPPSQKILAAAERLKEKGAFRYLGISGHNRLLFANLSGDSHYDLFQVRHNAANRGAEQDIFPHLPLQRPGIVSFTATRRMSLVKSKKIPAEEKRPTPGDCYRFVLSNSFVDVVISATSRAGQLKENLVEMAKGPMDPEEFEWMRRIGDYVYGRKSNGAQNNV